MFDVERRKKKKKKKKRGVETENEDVYEEKYSSSSCRRRRWSPKRKNNIIRRSQARAHSLDCKRHPSVIALANGIVQNNRSQPLIQSPTHQSRTFVSQSGRSSPAHAIRQRSRGYTMCCPEELMSQKRSEFTHQRSSDHIYEVIDPRTFDEHRRESNTSRTSTFSGYDADCDATVNTTTQRPQPRQKNKSNLRISVSSNMHLQSLESPMEPPQSINNGQQRQQQTGQRSMRRTCSHSHQQMSGFSSSPCQAPPPTPPRPKSFILNHKHTFEDASSSTSSLNDRHHTQHHQQQDFAERRKEYPRRTRSLSPMGPRKSLQQQQGIKKKRNRYSMSINAPIPPPRNIISPCYSPSKSVYADFVKYRRRSGMASRSPSGSVQQQPHVFNFEENAMSSTSKEIHVANHLDSSHVECGKENSIDTQNNSLQVNMNINVLEEDGECTKMHFNNRKDENITKVDETDCSDYENSDKVVQDDNHMQEEKKDTSFEMKSTQLQEEEEIYVELFEGEFVESEVTIV
eukprot:m.146507 g.146507  ORF g.146507 m.146507 type:complete len:515 (+) comp13234_c5_seq3:1953-3497(+)